VIQLMIVKKICKSCASQCRVWSSKSVYKW